MHVTDDHIPFFTSDQLSEYRDAVLNTYGIWYQRQRQGDRGCYPKPLRIPPPDLLYAQVVKVREQAACSPSAPDHAGTNTWHRIAAALAASHTRHGGRPD